MRRVSVSIVIVVSLLFASCSSNTIVAGGEERPTPQPAPTIAGEVIEVEPQEVAAQVVLIGVSSDQKVAVHALPGLDQPLAGEVPPGTPIEPLGNAFETDDGLTWWQVRAGSIQGWIQPNVAYQGPSEDITEQVRAMIPDTDYPTALVAYTKIASLVAADEGADEVVVVSRNETERRGATSTTDLLGLQDDSQIGIRLIITVDDAAGNGWELVSIFKFPLCSRGVATDGLCL